jgi:hypothetical protein
LSPPSRIWHLPSNYVTPHPDAKHTDTQQASSNIGLAQTYASKDRNDPRKLQFAERALCVATEVFQDANQAFNENAHPLQLPPFHGGADAGGDMDNTLVGLYKFNAVDP